eukprot:9470254-Prorocentrum_lima.AAC.1
MQLLESLGVDVDEENITQRMAAAMVGEPAAAAGAPQAPPANAAPEGRDRAERDTLTPPRGPGR